MKFIQIRYQIWYRIKKFLPIKDDKTIKYKRTLTFNWINFINNNRSFEGNNSFTFLNQNKSFGSTLDWNDNSFGKLWTYNLSYFDYLNQEDITKEQGLILIINFIENSKGLLDAKEPYPTSLRIINWIKFLCRFNIENEKIDAHLSLDIQRLSKNLEYHLLANHLLENIFALLFGAYYFSNKSLKTKAAKLLKKQLEEQILKDGAHYELSPMYHQLMLYRVLDCIQLNRQHSWFCKNLDSDLKTYAQKMLSWLTQITFNNGDIPLVNDAAFKINPTTNELIKYANHLEVSNDDTLVISESGYRMFKNKSYELFLDIGVIQPSYQPGHAHADISNFIVYKNMLPYIVDSGTSTYEKSKTREYQRSSRAHNVVTLNDKNSSNVWSGFRVSKRSKICSLLEKENEVQITYNNYHDSKTTQKRSWKAKDNSILIEDTFEGSQEFGTLNLHFHPSVEIKHVSKNHVETNLGNINFVGHAKIIKLASSYSSEFNKIETSNKIAVNFKSKLKTTIAF